MPRPIFQFPNPPLIAAIVADAVARTARGEAARAAGVASDVALLVWAVEEVFAGENWFRRVLGVGGAGAALSRLRARPGTGRV